MAKRPSFENLKKAKPATAMASAKASPPAVETKLRPGYRTSRRPRAGHVGRPERSGHAQAGRGRPARDRARSVDRGRTSRPRGQWCQAVRVARCQGTLVLVIIGGASSPTWTRSALISVSGSIGSWMRPAWQRCLLLAHVAGFEVTPCVALMAAPKSDDPLCWDHAYRSRQNLW